MNQYDPKHTFMIGSGFMQAATLGLVGRPVSCLKSSGKNVRRRRYTTAALAAAPRLGVARWRRHALRLPGRMDGKPRPIAAAARFARFYASLDTALGLVGRPVA